jgi:peptidoglycan hydrolase-like protein with peptidoglycan-binding domain
LLAAVALLLIAAVPPAGAAAKRLGDRTLAPGSRGNDVRTAQRALTALRFPARPR